MKLRQVINFRLKPLYLHLHAFPFVSLSQGPRMSDAGCLMLKKKRIMLDSSFFFLAGFEIFLFIRRVWLIF